MLFGFSSPEIHKSLVVAKLFKNQGISVGGKLQAEEMAFSKEFYRAPSVCSMALTDPAPRS